MQEKDGAAQVALAKGFDVTKEFVIRVPHPDSPGGKKSCTVRFPTDEEWSARSRKRVTVRRSLGRDAIKAEVLHGAEADTLLFGNIRIDKDGPEFDEAEASKVIGRLEKAEVSGVERVGSRYKVSLRVPGAIVLHELKIPTLRQTLDYGKSAVSSTGRRNSVETRIALEPSSELWEKLRVSVDGYVGLVPIVHKDAALEEVLLQVQSEMEEDDDPEE